MPRTARFLGWTMALLAGAAGTALAAAPAAASGGEAARARSGVDLVGWAVRPAWRSATEYVYTSTSPSARIGLGVEGAGTATPLVTVTMVIDLSGVASSLGVTLNSTADCHRASATITCVKNVTLGSQQPIATLTVTPAPASIGPAGYLTYSVSGGGDTNASNNAGRVSFDVITSNVTKLNVTTVPVQAPGIGAVVGVPVTIRNAGPNTDPSVTLVDAGFDSPAGAATPLPSDGCHVSGTRFSCVVSDLRAGHSVTLTLRFSVTECGPAPISGGFGTQSALGEAAGSHIGTTMSIAMACDSAAPSPPSVPSPPPSASPSASSSPSPGDATPSPGDPSGGAPDGGTSPVPSAALTPSPSDSATDDVTGVTLLTTPSDPYTGAVPDAPSSDTGLLYGVGGGVAIMLAGLGMLLLRSRRSDSGTSE